MGETSVAGLFIALAVLIVLSGPARMLRLAAALRNGLRAARRALRKDSPEAATNE
jgi:Sec-independent protein translocase protein TatA